MSPHRIIRPPGCHLYPSHHTEDHLYLYKTPLPPCPPCPCHACWIPNAPPFLPPQYLLTSHRDVSEPPFSVTTAHGASPLPPRLSTCCKYPVLASAPPTTPLLPINVRPQCLGSCFHENLYRWLAYPGPSTTTLGLFTHHLSKEAHVHSLQLPWHRRQQKPGLRPKKYTAFNTDWWNIDDTHRSAPSVLIGSQAGSIMFML